MLHMLSHSVGPSMNEKNNMGDIVQNVQSILDYFVEDIHNNGAWPFRLGNFPTKTGLLKTKKICALHGKIWGYKDDTKGG